MSRHSHWAKIKRGKGSADAARANLFTKLSRLVTVAAREGGGDPAFNFKLRLVLDRAKSEGMSKEAIERAIARGSGVGSGEDIELVTYEGFAPGGAAVIVECLTDNRNRAINEVKQVFRDHGANLGGEGSVRWQFARRGVLRVPLGDPKMAATGRDEVELELIGVGAEDLREEDGELAIMTKVEDLQKTREAAERFGLAVSDAALEWVPQQSVDVPEGQRSSLEGFLVALDALDDVQEVYTNASGY